MLLNFLYTFLNHLLRKVRGPQAMEKLRRCCSSGAGAACPASPPGSAHGAHQPPPRAGALLRGSAPLDLVSPEKHGLTLQKPKPLLLSCKTEAGPG